ncbi:MarR family winged helix-turn-helix transcriptional regulator [Kitasatospora kifunensis]|uniref:DNA-binding MarR family transcriptional regulator n=1 Tax=Kitasatospora kifunensis TaxID=58351 RepID=A0A7W7VXC6_KITKI|nr:MarR family winged helix-turn-helix transcriptional regulator [Kitasatospora kifunensis]MBB4926457.1 DNA-binding MarR family transcriptional regulator [Kitasatospora kifunensis]
MPATDPGFTPEPEPGPEPEPDAGPAPGLIDPDLADEFPALLAGIPRLVRRRLRQELTVPRLRGAQVELLRLVAANPGLRVSAAAKELCLAGNSVSTLVNQLVAAGLLRREVDPADRRAALLRVTPEAAERMDAWRANHKALVDGLVAELPTEDRAALAAALPALRRLAAQLQRGDDAGSTYQEGTTDDGH